MKRNFTLLILTVISFLFLNCSTGQSRISGEIKGLTDNTLIIKYTLLDAGATKGDDTIIASDGKFDFSPAIKGGAIIEIHPKEFETEFLFMGMMPIKYKSRIIALYLPEGGNITIKGEAGDGHVEYVLEGDELNSELSKHRAEMLPGIIKISEIYDSTLNFDKAKLVRPSKGQISEYLNNLQQEESTRNEYFRNYITDNLDKDLSAYYLLNDAGSMFEELHPRLSANVISGPFGTLLAEQVQKIIEGEAMLEELENNKGKLVPGIPMIPFTLPDQNGKKISLYEVKAEYIVLDFWASWCGPCLAGIPRMKEYHQKYKGRLEIIGIGCLDKHNNWLKTVKEKNAGWIQLFDEDIKKGVAATCGAMDLPTKIILDKQYKVIEVFVGEIPDFYKKLDELMK